MLTIFQYLITSTHNFQHYKHFSSQIKIPLHHFNSRLRKRSSGRNMANKMPDQSFDYFLVLDFEATCDNDRQPDPQEIIEWPVLKINAKTYKQEGKFHTFIKPRFHPVLTPFCLNLTTITQEEVDGGVSFPTALKDFETWIENEVGLDKKFVFVTCGDWDMKTMLPNQCQTENLQVPPYCRSWLNIKKAYAEMTGEFVKGMMPMIKGLGLTHEGTLHRGLDDCINIANILKFLGERGYKFYVTGGRSRD
ncbi:unnamed protein product [Meganyctiphanes norvegica]|uniref:Exonuclease domain-containing protein n=1 Tax=Meganyctiphanes norvegica TaxID=48144 RepID=A0AAV2PYY3_MEGNR